MTVFLDKIASKQSGPDFHIVQNLTTLWYYGNFGQKLCALRLRLQVWEEFFEVPPRPRMQLPYNVDRPFAHLGDVIVAPLQLCW
jgi:hypothetical protein